MNFDDSQAIYLQVADYIAEKILSEEWKTEQRIPSVREIAKSLKVNVNTVMRSYSLLQEKSIINNQRGIGYFVATSAPSLVAQWKRNEFTRTDLPKVFHQAKILGYTAEEINELYKNFLDNPS
ncbi:MAG: GntR family transcriptional regulator [Cellvibrionaceae bacterium]|nr:GntR family transcriptional regulator [Cellvibrionaceae bacterium]